jgi:hypothetical protein
MAKSDSRGAPPVVSRGSLVEDHARRLAAGMGIPDFVYQPALETRGGSSSEVSDGMLIVGNEGVILQVKSRDLTAGAKDDADRAERWCLKKGEHARRQGLGTRRRLEAGETSFVSLRGLTRVLPASRGWPIVVILDHPLVPSNRFRWGDGCLFMSMNDWVNLHARIRSTAGVVRYVNRAIEAGVDIPLGHEAERYRALSQADVAWASFRTPNSLRCCGGVAGR